MRISKGTINHRNISWVAKAIAKDDIRKALKLIKIEDGYAIATDGHRLHKAKLIDTTIENGLYQLFKIGTDYTLILDETDQTYPDHTRVIPDYMSFNNKTNLGDTELDSVYTSLIRLMSKMSDSKDRGYTVAYNYFKDMMQNKKNDLENYNVFTSDLVHPVVFINEYRTGIIMPVRV